MMEDVDPEGMTKLENHVFELLDEHPAVTAQASSQADTWPIWIEHGQHWCDSDGTIFDRRRHAWDREKTRPRVAEDGRFVRTDK